MDASIIKPFVDATSQFADCHFCAGRSNLPPCSPLKEAGLGMKIMESRVLQNFHGNIETSHRRHKRFIKSQNTAQLRGSNWSHRSLQRLRLDGAGMQMYSSAAGTPGKIQSNWSSHVFADVRASCLTNWSKVLEILDKYLYFWLWVWEQIQTLADPFRSLLSGSISHRPVPRKGADIDTSGAGSCNSKGFRMSRDVTSSWW